MRKNLENRLTMFEGLLSLLRDNDAKVQSVAGFTESAANFSSAVDSLKEKAVGITTASAGKTTDKYEAEDALVECLAGACSALYMFGRKQGNSAIMERADIPEYRMRKMRDTALASYGREIADLAEANSAELASFGFPGDRITELREKANVYNEAIGAKESGVASRMGTREEMISLFKKADDLLENELDRFMEIIRKNEAEFYSQYQAARSVRDAGIRHRRAEEPAGSAV